MIYFLQFLLTSVFFIFFLVFFAYKRCSLFTTIATDLEFLQYDLFPVYVFVLNFDESNASARAKRSTWRRHVYVCVCFLLNLQIGKTQFWEK